MLIEARKVHIYCAGSLTRMKIFHYLLIALAFLFGVDELFNGFVIISSQSFFSRFCEI